MKKYVVSLLLCGLVMRLAVMVGAEDSISMWADGIVQRESMNEEEREISGESAVAVGDIYTIPVELLEESGEVALSIGELPQKPPEAFSFAGGLNIRNDTSMDVDIDELTAEPMEALLSAEGPHVLIIHTHGSEAYTQSPGFVYEESDPYRTEDKDKSVIKVGDTLAEILEAKGLSVIHDRGIYDYPSYTGSYSRSGAAVEEYLRQYPDIALVIDLHRDALGSGDTVYKTRAETPKGECAQVMILVGTGENGLSHPNWKQNLRMGLYLQEAMEDAYPTLARPLALKSERYNQHLSPGAIILEVGSSGNTLPEAIAAIELFGDAAGDALMKLIKSE